MRSTAVRLAPGAARLRAGGAAPVARAGRVFSVLAGAAVAPRRVGRRPWPAAAPERRRFAARVPLSAAALATRLALPGAAACLAERAAASADLRAELDELRETQRGSQASLA